VEHMATDNNLRFTTIRKSKVVIHCCASPEDGESVNSYIVETDGRLVIIDAMLLRPYARELRNYANNLGKPIERVIVTHSHPDHFFGIEFFQDVDVYALPETIEEIKILGPLALNFHGGRHGEAVVDRLYFPNRTIGEGEILIDGVTFRLSKIVAAEDVYMIAIELPDERILLAQDLLYNKMHLFVGQRSEDGTLCFDGWIAALQQFGAVGYDLVLPGHGLPAAASIFQENISYLKAVRDILAVSTGETFVKNVLDAFPEYELASMVEFSNFFLFIMK